MTRTLLMPAEMLWRSSPRRWAAALAGLAAVGVAVGYAVAASVCGEDCAHF